MSTFTDSEIAYLNGQNLGRLATQKPNGTLQNSPVGFRYNPATDTIDIGGYNFEASRKFRNVIANRRVAFVVDDLASVRPWRPRCVEIRGRGEAIASDGTHPALIRIHPDRVISFGLHEPDREAHGLTIDARDVTGD
ncbi:PPOX class F420-dependent oxidoreductase [Xylanimonas sp. McL0601]|uniref:PPOX class F420-dependent oxidoreductase n=1 Tax=Xylanimonas sp. McL0601 TaxID=3414739 RepID=UPI003CFA73EB